MLNEWKWKTMRVSILVSLVNLSSLAMLLHYTDVALWQTASELRGDACRVVWSIPLVAVSTEAGTAGRAMSLFYANPCIWGVVGGDEQSGHVAPGGQAEWWRRRARSWCPCLGKECPDSSLDCRDTTGTLCHCAYNTPIQGKKISLNTNVFTLQNVELKLEKKRG